jgi:hypothetical protein
MASCKVTISLLLDGPYTTIREVATRLDHTIEALRRSTNYVILRAEKAFCPQMDMMVLLNLQDLDGCSRPSTAGLHQP